MCPPPPERWTFTMQLPADIDNGGRFVARVLKHLLRAWGVKATAILDAPAATHQEGEQQDGEPQAVEPKGEETPQ